MKKNIQGEQTQINRNAECEWKLSLSVDQIERDTSVNSMKSRFYEEKETGCLSSAAFTESAKNDLHENRNPKTASVT